MPSDASGIYTGTVMVSPIGEPNTQINVSLVTADIVSGPNPQDGWSFKVEDFVIGAWLGPDDKDAEMQVYKEAGFNAVMLGRYMSEGSYSHTADIHSQLTLAETHGLAAMIDTYTQIDKPWGGQPFNDPQAHHPASLEELQWLQQEYGSYPALAGYMLGDDQQAMDQRMTDCTNYLNLNDPNIFPWICQNVYSPDSVARIGNPIACPQFYSINPSQYDWMPVQKMVEGFCISLDTLRQSCNKLGLTSWPMFNVNGLGSTSYVISDSLLRLQVYASLAYGAQGIWYFTYRGSLNNGVEFEPGEDTYAAAKANVTDAWYYAKEANLRAVAYGLYVLDSKSNGVFNTGDELFGTVSPGDFKVVKEMSNDLLVGILTKPGQDPMAMVVDKRTSRYSNHQSTSTRLVHVTFNNLVSSIEVIDTASSNVQPENIAYVALKGGEGRLLLLNSEPSDTAALLEMASGEQVLATWEPKIKSDSSKDPLFVGNTEINFCQVKPGANIRYTLNGSEPTASSTLYTCPITLTGTTTVKAITDAPGTPYDGFKVSKKFFKVQSITDLACYRMGEGSQAGELGSMVIKDQSGNGFDLIRNGVPTVSSDTAPIEGSTVSMEFHGDHSSDFYVQQGLVTEDRDNFGMEVWAKADVANGTHIIACNGITHTSSFMIAQNQGRWSGIFGGIGGTSGPEYVQIGKWTHIVFITYGGEAIVYVDGVMSDTPHIGLPNTLQGQLVIGADYLRDRDYFDGLIDEVRVFTFTP